MDIQRKVLMSRTSTVPQALRGLQWLHRAYTAAVILLYISGKRWRAKNDVRIQVFENMMSNLQRKNVNVYFFRVLTNYHTCYVGM